MRLQQAYQKYREAADFTWVYISEAHAIDDPRPSRSVQIREHSTFEERSRVAEACAEALGLEIPLLIDDMENSVARAYAAHPDRLFILAPDGKVAYAGGRGPRGFDVDEMVTALTELVAE